MALAGETVQRSFGAFGITITSGLALALMASLIAARWRRKENNRGTGNGLRDLSAPSSGLAEQIIESCGALSEFPFYPAPAGQFPSS
jgi:hypothetical protein